MANQEHLDLLKQGTIQWNEWRTKHPDTKIDLSGADLSGADLSGADLTKVNLSKANLSKANLFRAYCGEANLSGADLRGAILYEANLISANLGGAYLAETDLKRAYLQEADLSLADLSLADLHGAICFHVEFAESSSRSEPVIWLRVTGGNAHSATIRWKHLASVELSSSRLPSTKRTLWTATLLSPISTRLPLARRFSPGRSLASPI